MQQAHAGEDALHLLVADHVLLERDPRLRRRLEKRPPAIHAEDGERNEAEGRRRDGGAEQRAPAPRGDQRDRDDDRQMRLVDEGAEAEAGGDRPRIEHQRAAAEQGGAEKSVLAMAEIAEHGGEGEDRQRAKLRPEPGAQHAVAGKAGDAEPQRRATTDRAASPAAGKAAERRADRRRRRNRSLVGNRAFCAA